MTLSESLKNTLDKLPKHVSLVAVSKTRANEEILELYNAGQRDFGENKVQELVEKYEALPKDIIWHQIGHLQKNKVKYIAPFVSLIHSVDSIDLMQIIEKEAVKNNRIISVLLQIKIAKEDTKFGLSFTEALKILEEKQKGEFPHIEIKGLMGMASFTENLIQVKEEFSSIHHFFNEYKSKFNLSILSTGMSDDHSIAIEEGSTMVRIGSSLFGPRNYV